MRHGMLLAALLFAMVLLPSSARASITNCPKEPAQGVGIVSGQTYWGTNCVISTAAERDTFVFNAAAGDTWTMVAGVPPGTVIDLCLTLLAPGGTTTVFSGCTAVVGVVNSVGTTQKLATKGLYTIKLTEVKDGAISYGVSLERVSPQPPDGIPLVLGQVNTGGINAPTAMDAYTFVADTAGVYEVAASVPRTSITDVCFTVYQPDGTIAPTTPANPACTSVRGVVDSVKADLTPAQNGTYVVIASAGGGDTTVGFSLSVSCLSAPGTCKIIPPPCKIIDAASYDAPSGTLTMNFTLGTAIAVTWNGWLVSQNLATSMWSEALPVSEPPVTKTKTQASVAKAGNVAVLSTFTTPTGGITCSNLTLVNTGKP